MKWLCNWCGSFDSRKEWPEHYCYTAGKVRTWYEINTGRISTLSDTNRTLQPIR